MQIILTHDNSDFDAFASLMAAQILYPDAQPVLGRRVQRAVRDFLAVHKDEFATLRHTDVDGSAVERVVVVDTRKPSRLPPINGLDERLAAGDVDLHIFDHHRAARDDLHGSFELIEPVGACITLVTERIRQMPTAANLSSELATLCLCGIYADTGSLSFSGTTARDMHAAGWLMDQGARLDVVNRFLRSTLGQEQQAVLAGMLSETQHVLVGDVDVGIVCLDLGRFVPGLATVVRHVLEFEGHGALFGIFSMGKRGVQIIARSQVPYIDVGKILAQLGGGGHPGAAAAKLGRDVELVEVREKLLARLEADPPRPQIVADIMSSPVTTVGPKLILGELQESLQTWRHTGVPVVDGPRLVGIISRRDVARAAADSRLHLPVGSCMTHEVKTIEPTTPLEAALDTMIAADIGRMPVLDGPHIVGIVTRTDILNVLYDRGDADERSPPLDEADSRAS